MLHKPDHRWDKKLIALSICAGVVLSGCGKQAEQISYYGTIEENSSTEISSNTSESSANTEQKDREAAGQDTSYSNTSAEITDSAETLVNQLSSDAVNIEEVYYNENGVDIKYYTLSFEDTFTIRNIPVKVYFNYSIRSDQEGLAVDHVHVPTKDDVHEDDVVTALFGDTAAKVETGDNEPGYYSMNEIRKLILNDHRENVTSIPMWVDDDDFYYHTWSGTYSGNPYRLLIGFDDVEKIKFISLYPDTAGAGDAIGEPSCTGYTATDYDTAGIWNADFTEMKQIPLSTLKSSENRSRKSDEELLSTAYSFMENMLKTKLPDGALSLYWEASFGSLGKIAPPYEPEKTQMIFYPETAYDTESLENAVLDGYEGSIYLPRNWIYSEEINCGVVEYDENALLSMNADGGHFMVTDQGVIGITCYQSYVPDGRISENVCLLSIDQISDALKVHMADDFNVSVIAAGKTVMLGDPYLFYYPQVSPEDPADRTFIPAWCISVKADSFDNDIAYVYINAIDGNLIDVEYNK